ncbi:Protein of unknown function [Gryllus bimaculatus]|nr:Protein of unknown function [Gryllus bimaculatus]
MDRRGRRRFGRNGQAPPAMPLDPRRNGQRGVPFVYVFPEGIGLWSNGAVMLVPSHTFLHQNAGYFRMVYCVPHDILHCFHSKWGDECLLGKCPKIQH